MKCLKVLAAGLAVACWNNSALAWRLDLNFNNGEVGKAADRSPAVFGSAGGVLYTTAKSFEGGKGVEMNITAGDTGFGIWGGIIGHPTALKKATKFGFACAPTGHQDLTTTLPVRVATLSFFASIPSRPVGKMRVITTGI